MTHYLLTPRKTLGSYEQSKQIVVDGKDPRLHDEQEWYKLDSGVLKGNIFTPTLPWNNGVPDKNRRYVVAEDGSALFMNNNGDIIERLGVCHVCGKGAAVNAPAIDPKIGLQKSPIWCDRCASVAEVMLVGIEQTLVNGFRQYQKQYGVVYKRNITAHLNAPWQEGGRVEVAWFHGGRTAIPKAAEKARIFETNEDPHIEAFLDAMSARQDMEMYFCTRCGKDLPKEEIAGRPLFAGLACETCYEKHKQHLEQQRKAGKVCRRCREPFDNCCC